MPTYEYACKTCEQHFDVVQSFSDDPLTTCPSCGGELRKVFGNISISFKGSGFYKNDSRSTPASASSAPATVSSESIAAGTSTESTKAAEGASTPAATTSDGGSTSTPPAKKTSTSSTDAA